MGARQYFYQESLAEATTTAATAQSKFTFTFQPDANSTYWFLCTGAFACSSQTSGHGGIVNFWWDEGAVSFGYHFSQPKELTTPQDYVPFFALAKITVGASPPPQNITVMYWSQNAGDTTKIKDVRAIAIKADAADQYAESVGTSSTASTSYQTKATLTFTPTSTGDYLVLAVANLEGPASAAARGRLNYVTGSATYGDKPVYFRDGNDWLPFAVMEKLNLSNAAKTFQLEYKSEAGSTIQIEDARILALRLDAFDNAYFASNHSGQNTTSASDTDFLTLTATPQAVDHLVLATGAWGPASTTVSGYTNVAKDGSTVEEWVREGVNTAGYMHAAMAQKLTVSNVSTTWKWRARAETAGTTINVGSLALAVLQLDASPAAGTRRRQMSLAA